MRKKIYSSHSLPLKKKYGQHFLRDHTIVENAVRAAKIDITTSVIEIGCGDGFLTRALLEAPLARLWIFEIDPHWADYVKKTFPDPRIVLYEENILDVDFNRFVPHRPWALVANIPYQITFPILYRIKEHRRSIPSGVIMIQEEVAQKITKTSGAGYGFPSLFFQRFFTWQKLDKVPPEAFYPPPKVFSRLLHFQAKKELPLIKDEELFWKFIKQCFKQPRRTLKNNLACSGYNESHLSPLILSKRAQQLSMDDFLEIWHTLQNKKASD